jgi:hypothetical protein
VTTGKPNTDKFAEALNALLDDGNKLAAEIGKVIEGQPASIAAIAMFLVFENIKTSAPDVCEICTGVYRQSKVNLETEAQRAAIQGNEPGPTFN